MGSNVVVIGPALQIPTGNILSRPLTPLPGYIRYNSEIQQFEGYGPGNAWGSLGGVVDIAQTTKILASATPSTTDGNLYFYTIGDERMRINSAGNIGIGTSSPTSLLDVSGLLKSINLNVSSSLSAIGNSNTVGNIFTTNGNVGIGISTPGYHLDVNGNVHVNANLYVDGVISGGTETASTFAYLTLTSTDDAINLSTGSLLTYGGITVQSPADAESVTNGGSFLTDGGASIGKRLFVGKNAIIGENLTVQETVAVMSTNNATGIGTGGSLTVLGGASISRDVYVGGTVTSSSDIRLKTNIEDFNTSKMLDKIDNIRSIKYNYKNDDSNTPYVGFIAQDFIEDFPELLRCPQGGYYSLDYQKVSVILMECIKELKTELVQLQDEIKEIKPARKRVLRGGKRVIYEDE